MSMSNETTNDANDLNTVSEGKSPFTLLRPGSGFAERTGQKRKAEKDTG